MKIEIKEKETSPFEVRLASLSDLETAVELALEIPRENSEAFPKPSPSKVKESLKKLIEEKSLILYENNGVVVGVLGLIIDTHWWTEEPTMFDMLFYIKPEFRSYKAFRRMLSVAEEFAKINGIPLSMMFFSTKDLFRKMKLLKKRGFEPIGFWMTKPN